MHYISILIFIFYRCTESSPFPYIVLSHVCLTLYSYTPVKLLFRHFSKVLTGFDSPWSHWKKGIRRSNSADIFLPKTPCFQGILKNPKIFHACSKCIKSACIFDYTWLHFNTIMPVQSNLFFHFLYSGQNNSLRKLSVHQHAPPFPESYSDLLFRQSMPIYMSFVICGNSFL